jgi:hypothetical protein
MVANTLECLEAAPYDLYTVGFQATKANNLSVGPAMYSRITSKDGWIILLKDQTAGQRTFSIGIRSYVSLLRQTIKVLGVGCLRQLHQIRHLLAR